MTFELHAVVLSNYGGTVGSVVLQVKEVEKFYVEFFAKKKLI